MKSFLLYYLTLNNKPISSTLIMNHLNITDDSGQSMIRIVKALLKNTKESRPILLVKNTIGINSLVKWYSEKKQLIR